jgi:hypothetical protein
MELLLQLGRERSQNVGRKMLGLHIALGAVFGINLKALVEIMMPKRNWIEEIKSLN